jgi:chromate transporter
LKLAAFYDPVWTAAITDSTRLAFALVVFALLRFAATPPWLLVLLSAGIGSMIF